MKNVKRPQKLGMNLSRPSVTSVLRMTEAKTYNSTQHQRTVPRITALTSPDLFIRELIRELIPYKERVPIRLSLKFRELSQTRLYPWTQLWKKIIQAQSFLRHELVFMKKSCFSCQANLTKLNQIIRKKPNRRMSLLIFPKQLNPQLRWILTAPYTAIAE